MYKSGRFKVRGQKYVFTRARLYADRLVLQGWSWRGHFRRDIPLHALKEVIWWTGATRVNLELRYHGDDRFLFWVSGAELWKLAIENRIAVVQSQARMRSQELMTPLAEAPVTV